MEWITQWFDRIFQSVFWRSVIGHFQWIDWLTILLVFAGVIYGIRKGFMPILGEILQLIAVITLTLELDGKIYSFLKTYLGGLSAESVKLIAFLIAAVLFWLIIDFIAKYLAKIITAQTSSALKVVGGAAGGAFYLFLFLSFVSQAILMSPLDAVKGVYEKKGSYSGYFLAQTAPRIHLLITHPLQSTGLSSSRAKG